MEAEVRRSRSPAALPAYEEWPSAPTAPPKHIVKDEHPSPMEIDDIKSTSDRTTRQTSELSDMEAAQVLECLRTDNRQATIHSSTVSKSDNQNSQTQSSQQAEPLLSLFTSRHPLLSSTINGSLHAYSSSKSYSPSFKYGAEFVERIGSPVVNTVGTAGRISGVETGVRWWLQRNDSESAPRGSKRRRTDQNPMDVDMERGLGQTSSCPADKRRLSEMSYSDTLPPYDSQRSPKYEEKSPTNHTHEESHPEYHPSWSSRLIKSTSGLGVAMSEESLASLRWALQCLSWANRHLTRLIRRLQDAIEQSDRVELPLSPESNTSSKQEESHTVDTEESTAASRERGNQIQALAAEVIYIIQRVNNGVSEYAASALPENARDLVGRYLKSLHISFQRSFSGSNNGDGQSEGLSGSESSARKALLLASEALDKLAQVSGIVEGTIVSAEEWLARLGKRRNDTPNGSSSVAIPPADKKESLVLTTVSTEPTTKDVKPQLPPEIEKDVAMVNEASAPDNVISKC